MREVFETDDDSIFADRAPPISGPEIIFIGRDCTYRREISDGGGHKFVGYLRSVRQAFLGDRVNFASSTILIGTLEQ